MSMKKAAYKRGGRKSRLPDIRARDRPAEGKMIKRVLKDNCRRCFQKLPKIRWKEILTRNFPYLFCGYFGSKVSYVYRTVESGDVFFRVMMTVEKAGGMFSNPFPSLNLTDLLFGIACGAALKAAVYVKKKNAKKYRHGVEYGSARWGNEKDIAPYI